MALCTTLLHARPTGDDDVVTRLRFGGIFNDNNRFLLHFMISLRVKEFLKSIHI